MQSSGPRGSLASAPAAAMTLSSVAASATAAQWAIASGSVAAVLSRLDGQPVLGDFRRVAVGHSLALQDALELAPTPSAVRAIRVVL
jgi:hypothetical protein